MSRALSGAQLKRSLETARRDTRLDRQEGKPQSVSAGIVGWKASRGRTGVD